MSIGIIKKQPQYPMGGFGSEGGGYQMGNPRSCEHWGSQAYTTICCQQAVFLPQSKYFLSLISLVCLQNYAFHVIKKLHQHPVKDYVSTGRGGGTSDPKF